MATVPTVAVVAAACAGGLVGDPSGQPRDRADRPPTDLVPDLDREPVPALVRRLTSDELVYTLEDALGVTLTDAERGMLPVDRPLAGFVNTAVGQTTSPDHVLAFSRLADAVVARPAFHDTARGLAGCQATTAACGDALVAHLGARLFRRPVEVRERALYGALFEAVAAEGLGFGEVAAAVGSAMLQSPAFLYRVEPEIGFDTPRALSGWELASRLSYLVWASAPDEALYAAAEAGELATREGVLAQLERLLEDHDRTRRVLDRFLLDWARLDSLPDDDGLRSELIDAAVAFYVDHVEADRPLVDLLDAETAMLTPALARNLGLEPAGPGVRSYDLAGAPDRIGLLSQPGVVAGMTNADGGAIVARGLFLTSQLFCDDVPDPPASLQGEIDAFVEGLPATASDRDVSAERLERDACATCHQAFDPLAYAFERFDFRGRFRDRDEHGNALRTDGWFPAWLAGRDRDTPYADLEAYASALPAMERVRRCLAQRQLEYALGARLDARHAVAVDEVRARADDAGGTWRALLRALVVDELFRFLPPAEEHAS